MDIIFKATNEKLEYLYDLGARFFSGIKKKDAAIFLKSV
jgi:hypothetical protein